MSDIKVDIKDLKDFHKSLEELDKKSILERISKKTMQRFLNRVIKNTPVDSGYLRKSWLPTIEELGDGYLITIFTNVEYAPYVNNGHRIMKKGKQIGFYNGQFFIEKAQIKTESEIEKIVNVELEKVLKELLKK